MSMHTHSPYINRNLRAAAQEIQRAYPGVEFEEVATSLFGLLSGARPNDALEVFIAGWLCGRDAVDNSDSPAHNITVDNLSLSTLLIESDSAAV